MSQEDVLLIFPGASGTFLASRVGDVEMQAIAIDLSLLCGVLTVPECRALSSFSVSNQQKVMYLPREHAFSVRFSDICRTQRTNALLSRLKLLQLFAELIDDGLQVPASNDMDFTDSRARMRQLIQQIPEAELMRCSVVDLAKKLCCSQRHFSRLFREEVGVSLREKQKKLRLERARHLLEQSSDKIIDIALDAGYQSLSLFNVMFKDRFKMTPSQWRARVQSAPSNNKRRSPGGRAMLVVLFAMVTIGAALGSRLLAADAAPAKPLTYAVNNRAASTNATPATPAAPASTNAGPRFPVTGYRVVGNTLLSMDTMKKVLGPHTGEAVGLDTIRKAVADLVLAYRERGFATVNASLPQQQITNGLVSVQVTEGRLAEVVVVNNRHFSSNNVVRALPSLTTGLILNSKYFQAELDQANANRDRQIYPQIQPGPEPGTSTLLLKVKDRMPLHGRVELNNHKTPDTPDLRLNTSLQYNNLWQLEHSAGFQYGFTPTSYKSSSPSRPDLFVDRPLIAFYNGFYRMPLGAPQSVENRAASRPTQFGYNEATRQFSVPSVSLVPELYLFGNRSTTDSGVKRSPTIRVTPATNAVSITRWMEDRNFSVTESFGVRMNWPLVLGNARAGLSFGWDLRHYESVSYHTNVFAFTSVIPPANPNDPPETVTAVTPSGTDGRTSTLTYLPVVFRADVSFPDKLGVTALSAGATYNVALDALSDGSEFEALTGSTNSTAGFLAFTGSLIREQKIGGDWRLFLRAEGQAASEPLFSNEQFALGGVSSVRGYMQGESFGDAGFRLSLEPRSPAVNMGKIGDAPVSVRFIGFLDYGRTFLLEPLGRDQNTTLSGFGTGMNWTIGKTFDLGAIIAWPMSRTIYTDNKGTARLYFNVSAQF